jgi:predicted AAA+ superfamily ATPase
LIHFHNSAYYFFDIKNQVIKAIKFHLKTGQIYFSIVNLSNILKLFYIFAAIKIIKIMVERELLKKTKALLKKYPIVSITGPRQSGKSTLLKSAFKDYKYVSLEDIDIREFADKDSRGFISTFNDKVIIDEVQQCPKLFSFLQTHVDKENKEGMYLLSGSHNFLLMQAISQSLAGRCAILTLLPFSLREKKTAKIMKTNINDEIFFGSYPRIYDKDIFPTDFYPYYIQTYVERDVRMIKNIENINLFTRFIKLCAGRIGQILNLSSLANDCSISVSTVQSWLSLLEASYIVYLLKPESKNYNKRLIKSPKLYFYDTGLACSLLDIRNSEQLDTHFLRGSLFENYVINEKIKDALNEGVTPQITYFRDKVGHEVDLIEEKQGKQYGYEIKSSQTFNTDFFKNLNYWRNLSQVETSQCNIIYLGDLDLKTKDGNVIKYF